LDHELNHFARMLREPIEVLRQRTPRYKLRCKEGKTFVIPDFVDGDDSRVVQLRGRRRFNMKPLNVGVRREAAPKDHFHGEIRLSFLWRALEMTPIPPRAISSSSSQSPKSLPSTGDTLRGWPAFPPNEPVCGLAKVGLSPLAGD
jgi:hypothetical protein